MHASPTPCYKEIQGHFILQQRFGQGSYGEVFKAQHKSTGQVIALKRVSKGALNLIKHMPEIRAMKSCSSTHIVAYYGCEWLREDLLIAMEFCEFGSLSDVMKLRAKAFTEAQVAYVMRRTLKALAYLASNNKVHRDIKPANIMLCGDGKTKLGDLGIAKDLKPDGTLCDRIGSVLYLAPEIARDCPYNAKVDVWSLGITAVELMVGRAPRSSDRTKEILKQLVTESTAPVLHLPCASPACIAFLQRILQVDPAKRPTASELLQDPFIVNASASSFRPLIAELHQMITLAGGFQSALQQVSPNVRIEPATCQEVEILNNAIQQRDSEEEDVQTCDTDSYADDNEHNQTTNSCNASAAQSPSDSLTHECPLIATPNAPLQSPVLPTCTFVHNTSRQHAPYNVCRLSVVANAPTSPAAERAVLRPHY